MITNVQETTEGTIGLTTGTGLTTMIQETGIAMEGPTGQVIITIKNATEITPATTTQTLDPTVGQSISSINQNSKMTTGIKTFTSTRDSREPQFFHQGETGS